MTEYFKDESIFQGVLEFNTPDGKLRATIDAQDVQMIDRTGRTVRVFEEVFNESGEHDGYLFDKEVFVRGKVTCSKIYTTWIAKESSQQRDKS